MPSATHCADQASRFLSYKDLPELSSNSQKRSLGEGQGIKHKNRKKRKDQHWLNRRAARRVFGNRRMPPKIRTPDPEGPYFRLDDLLVEHVVILLSNAIQSLAKVPLCSSLENAQKKHKTTNGPG